MQKRGVALSNGPTARLGTFAALVLALLLAAGPAVAELTVTIEDIEPDNELTDGESVTIFWTIETDGESGEYYVEIGGDGTPGSGEQIAASDGNGSFSGDYQDSSTVQADEDLTDGDGDYTVYVIAESDSSKAEDDDDDDDDTGDYASASATLTLENVPYAPEGLGLDAGDTRLFLTWDEHDDRDLDHINVYYGTSPGASTADYNGSGATGGDSPIDISVGTEYELAGLDNDVAYYVRIAAVDDAGQESELSAEVTGTPVTVSGLAGLSDQKNDCFVATAAFGDYEAREVRVLRAFRDTLLRRSAAGLKFIELYGTYGPRAAALIAPSPLARLAARTALQPAVTAAWLALHPLALLALAPLLLLPVARRRFQDRRAR